MKCIFDLCEPRPDVLQGRLRDDEFAADLASVVSGTASPDYQQAALFFGNTHPTRGLRTLMETICRRLSGTGGELNSIIRLDTQYGGGKTHSLIALVHAVRGMQGVSDVKEFVDPKILPTGHVRVAAMDGENSDPANGLELEPGLRAHSLWGQMAYALDGRRGYELVRQSDETHTAPGDRTIAQLFGGEPTLILIDEVSVYLRKVAHAFPDATLQFTAFIHALIKAVSSSPRVALVCTLALKADSKSATDAYREEQQIAMQAFDEAESVLSRKATQINPTQDDEAVDVIRRRLFKKIDAAGARDVVDAYAKIWNSNKESLSTEAFRPETQEQFLRGYPLHPETLNVLIEKTSSLSTFQRTRGMLRILARTVNHLWQDRPTDTFAIHPHHIDPGNLAIRDEIVTRWGQQAFAPALGADIAAVEGKAAATAQQLDADRYTGLPPVASFVARTVFLNTLAYGEAAQGIKADHLRYSVCGPSVDPSLVEQARKAFVEESLFMDDRPGAPMRFRVEANLTQMIRKAMKDVDPDEVRKVLNERIRDHFGGGGYNFELIPFPSAGHEVPDEIGDGRPFLVVLGYDAFAVADEPTSLPGEIVRMATRKGTNDEYRTFQNNLVFLVADERNRGDMKQAVKCQLALEALANKQTFKDLAEHQQTRVKAEQSGATFTVAQAIALCYRHLFYPSNVKFGSSDAMLSHIAIEYPNSSHSPGNGQLHIRRILRDHKKLLEAGDKPDAPGFVRDQTPLKTKGFLTTADLRNEFRKCTRLSMLMDNSPLVACIQAGIAAEVFIYRKGELVWGKDDPAPSVEVSDDAFVHTLAHARHLGIWPHKKTEPVKSKSIGIGSGGGDDDNPPDPNKDDPRLPLSAQPDTFSAEGPLRQALVEIFEHARTAKATSLSQMRIRLFEATATWNLHQALATYKEASIVCQLSTTIVAEGVTNFRVEFEGILAKASAIRSFLDPQLRSCTDHTFEGTYTLTFPKPYPTTSESGEALLKALTKYGGGEAFVEATAAREAK